MKKHIAMLTALLLSAALCACDNSEKTAADINYLYGQISEISGNDLTLLVAEYDESDEKTEEKDKESSDNSEDSKSQNRGNKGNRPQGGFDRENMPEGFDPENMPEGGFDRENMPEGFDPENMPEGGFDRENSKAPQSNVKGYTFTGEEQQIRIPVGATVTIALGVETDFDVLKTGDMIKYTTKKDDDGNEVITAVWIVE